MIACYCLSERFWRLCLSSNSEARGGPILLKFLSDNLASICVWFCPFSGKQKKNEAVFYDFFGMVKFSMLWKLSEKSSEVFPLSVGQLTLISTNFWNFPIRGSGAISGFPEITYFSGVYPAKFENFFWSYSSLVDDLWRKIWKNVYIFINI